jgi:hypothetical protein
VQGALDAEAAEVEALGDDEEALEAYYAKQLAMGRRGGGERVRAEDADLAASDAEFDAQGTWKGGASDLDDTDSDDSDGYDAGKAVEKALNKRADAERRLVARARAARAGAPSSSRGASINGDSGAAPDGIGGAFVGQRSDLKGKRGETRAGGGMGLTRSGKRRRGLLLRTEGSIQVDEESELLPTAMARPVAGGAESGGGERGGADSTPLSAQEGGATDVDSSSESPPTGRSELGVGAAAAPPALVRHGSHVAAMLAVDDETRTAAEGLTSVSAASLKLVADEASRHAVSTAATGALSLTAALRAVVSGGDPPSAAAGSSRAASHGTGTPSLSANPARGTGCNAIPAKAPLMRSSSLGGIDLSSLMGGSNSRAAANGGAPALRRGATFTGGLPSNLSQLGGVDSTSRAAASMTFGFGIGSSSSRHAGDAAAGEEAGAAARKSSAAAAAAGRVKSGNTRAFVFTSTKQRAAAVPVAAPGSAAGSASGGTKRARPVAMAAGGPSKLGSLFGQKLPRG